MFACQNFNCLCCGKTPLCIVDHTFQHGSFNDDCIDCEFFSCSNCVQFDKLNDLCGLQLSLFDMEGGDDK